MTTERNCTWPLCPTDFFGTTCAGAQARTDSRGRYGKPTAEEIEQGQRDAFEAMCEMNGQDPAVILAAYGRTEAAKWREEPKGLTVTVAIQIH